MAFGTLALGVLGLGALGKLGENKLNEFIDDRNFTRDKDRLSILGQGLDLETEAGIGEFRARQLLDPRSQDQGNTGISRFLARAQDQRQFNSKLAQDLKAQVVPGALTESGLLQRENTIFGAYQNAIAPQQNVARTGQMIIDTMVNGGSNLELSNVMTLMVKILDEGSIVSTTEKAGQTQAASGGLADQWRQLKDEFGNEGISDEIMRARIAQLTQATVESGRGIATSNAQAQIDRARAGVGLNNVGAFDPSNFANIERDLPAFVLPEEFRAEKAAGNDTADDIENLTAPPPGFVVDPPGFLDTLIERSQQPPPEIPGGVRFF
jgi:hypothetical protein